MRKGPVYVSVLTRYQIVLGLFTYLLSCPPDWRGIWAQGDASTASCPRAHMICEQNQIYLLGGNLCGVKSTKSKRKQAGAHNSFMLSFPPSTLPPKLCLGVDHLCFFYSISIIPVYIRHAWDGILLLDAFKSGYFYCLLKEQLIIGIWGSSSVSLSGNVKNDILSINTAWRMGIDRAGGYQRPLSWNHHGIKQMNTSLLGIAIT